MTTEEFSNEFDVLLNSYSNSEFFGKAPNTIELDEYEKSVFLTKAQEDIVLEIYNGKNPFGDSFEKTEEIRSYLRQLIKSYQTSTPEELEEGKEKRIGLTSNSVFFKLPTDLWFITYESVNFSNIDCGDTDNIMVVPVTQDEFHRIKKNPFRGNNRRRVLRVDAGSDIIELISKYDISSYMIRYMVKPEPIILTGLPDSLYINKVNKKTDCKLNPAIHRAILERAVKLALRSKVPNAGNNV